MRKRFTLFAAPLLSCCMAFTQAPAPAQPAGITSSSSTDIQQFQKIEDNWSNALNMRDQYALELVLSPLFVGISASGDVTTRNQQVAQILSNADKTLHLDQHIVTVRLLGDIAVANGTYNLHHKEGTQAVDEKGVFTHVFERQHGAWLCVNSQRTVIRQDTPGAKKKKPSQAEEPFHIPFFGKSDKQQ